ncbi:hypothetical protein G9F72_010805 [Clostridium estertheticum]|uniref:hypothetical protein n=1 Tax=Clostridium estertheticum TaxID=238834 RepID=UPI0013E948D7|nr:hypothetical protein [Clostridium estertheticum]MBZ9686814.1 hypothetical protein [Clostridium estertheticum]
MKFNVFYSWQSDLPNKDNRSFIEECIKKAMKMNAGDINVGEIFDYDRDTKGVSGSPDIADIIFNKISKSDLFICDISIINSDYDGRKMPNPNVLVELGYAAKTIGWEKIICFFNIKYGCLDDIPFDLNHRRIFHYNSDTDNEKQSVAKGLSESIKLMYSRGLLFNPLKDHMKGKIDYNILGILKQISCMVYRIITMSEALAKTPKLLSLKEDQLLSILKKREPILGFFANNDLNSIKELLTQTFLTLTTSNLYPLEWSLTVLKLLDWIRKYQYLISKRAKQKLYCSVLSPESLLKVISAYKMNPSNPPNSYILMKKVGTGAGQILYYATMPNIDEKYLLSPYTMNECAVDNFSDCIFEIISLVNKWLDETGSEFILDPDYYKIDKTPNTIEQL